MGLFMAVCAAGAFTWAREQMGFGRAGQPKAAGVAEPEPDFSHMWATEDPALQGARAAAASSEVTDAAPSVAVPCDESDAKTRRWRWAQVAACWHPRSKGSQGAPESALSGSPSLSPCKQTRCALVPLRSCCMKRSQRDGSGAVSARLPRTRRCPLKICRDSGGQAQNHSWGRRRVATGDLIGIRARGPRSWVAAALRATGGNTKKQYSYSPVTKEPGPKRWLAQWWSFEGTCRAR